MKKRLPGNGCGHDPNKPRKYADKIKRGKGGHPPILGQMVSLANRIPFDKTVLKTWQSMNPSGRQRRSEVRQDACPSLLQFIFTCWLDLCTHRFLTYEDGFLVVPNLDYMSNKMSESDGWEGWGITIYRIKRLFKDFEECGYMTSTRMVEKNELGEHRAVPSIRVFTKKFFIELGGQQLWEKLRTQGKKKAKQLEAKARELGTTLKKYLNPGVIKKPLQAFFINLKKNKVKNKIRASRAYQEARTNLIIELGRAHLIHAPPDKKWSKEQIDRKAQKILDKKFGLI